MNKRTVEGKWGGIIDYSIEKIELESSWRVF
jgi:hypothetical protein